MEHDPKRWSSSQYGLMEVWTLTARLLRTTLRSRAALATVLVFMLGVLVAAWLGVRESHVTGVLLFGPLALLAFVVTGAAVGASSVLPEDRAAGREEWLATLAPPAWKRRLAAVLSGWLLAVLLGTAGGLLLGALTAGLRPDVSLRTHRPLALPQETVSAGAQRPVVLELVPVARSGDVVEVEVRPRFRLHGPGGLVNRLRLRWRAGAEQGEREVSARGAVRFEPPEGAARLELTSATPNVQLRVVAARWLGPQCSPVWALGLTGLLLGILAGAAAPIGVLLSRQTTGQTAAAAAFSLLLLGAARESLLAFAGSLEADGWTGGAPAVLQTVVWLAPDVAVFGVIEQVLAGLVPAGLPVAALIYTVLATGVACVPAPRLGRSGESA